MELTVLGSGTSVPHPRRSSSGYWLKTSAGTILLDCSASSIHRMVQEGLDWPNLDAIWISHFHLDHIGGLAPFLFGIRHAVPIQSRRKPLRIFAAHGIERLIRSINDLGNYKLFKQPFPIEIVEVEAMEKFEILSTVEAVALSTPHTDDSHAIHIGDNGSTMVYTSDTGASDEIAAFSRRVDLLLMECSFFRNKPTEKHLELVEAIHIIRKAEPRRAVLTHLYPVWDDVNFDSEIMKLGGRPTEVLQAFDGLKVVVSGQTKS